jgi:hypothetical protein
MLWARIAVTVCLFFSVWLCVYGFQATETVQATAVNVFMVLFGLGSAGWIVYSIATLGRDRRDTA